MLQAFKIGSLFCGITHPAVFIAQILLCTNKGTNVLSLDTLFLHTTDMEAFKQAYHTKFVSSHRHQHLFFRNSYQLCHQSQGHWTHCQTQSLCQYNVGHKKPINTMNTKWNNAFCFFEKLDLFGCA